MLKKIADFLALYWDGHSPLLLGYSGGPDSKALLYALLENGCKALHLAHVDHSWRPESKEETALLQQEAEMLGLPFHSIQLAALVQTARGITGQSLHQLGGAEAAARRERLLFFRSLFDKIPFQALLLAHHADDVAETVLKRVLEGAHLSFLGGMDSVAHIEAMPIWRPCLSLKRCEIEAFLAQRELKALRDSTNFDPKYLRARMRVTLLPHLASLFGKEISDNLNLLAARAFELKTYLDTNTSLFIPSRGPWGLFGFLADIERIEARHLLQKWAKEQKIHLPRSFLESALDAVRLRCPNRRIAARIIVDRGYVFLLSERPPSWGKKPLQIAIGSWNWGEWTVDVAKEDAPPTFEGGWQKVWSGQFTVFVSGGWLKMPPSARALGRLWNETKVPAFFRHQVPIVWSESNTFSEFLTGKILPEIGPYFKLTISNSSGIKR